MRYMMVLVLCFLNSSYLYAAQINLYSARKETLLRPLIEDFKALHNIEVNIVFAPADTLISRLESEKEHTPADILLTVDAARLHRAKQRDLLQPINSERLSVVVPAAYRDDDNHWFGLSIRARTVIYAKGRVDKQAFSDYWQLASPVWNKRLCVRSSTNIYNQSLVADLMIRYGEQQVEHWVHELVSNFARSPKGGDRDQIKAVAAGQCDIALVNTYYLAGMLNSTQPEEVSAAQHIDVAWLAQDGHGVHVNISGAGVLKHAKNKKAAIQFLEYLVSKRAQTLYAENNFEYPIRSDIPLPSVLENWGKFKSYAEAVKHLGRGNIQAILLMDRAGWR